MKTHIYVANGRGVVYESHDDSYDSQDGNRIIIAKHSHYFYVMSAGNGELFDPHDPSDSIMAKQCGSYVYSLKKCNEECYEQYVLFLQTRNKKYLRIAQRRFLDG